MIFDLLAPPQGPTTLGVGSKGQNSTFSEQCHIALKIKWNHVCSNMVANILPADPSPPPPYTNTGGWSKKAKIQIMVMLHIQLNGITYAASW